MNRERVLKVYLTALWLVCAYRAVTQSIVHDEALTYQFYLAGPAARIFDFFDANHHFLNTLLMKVSVSLFGLSEWSMRLPALAGAALYFAAVYRIAVREFRGNLASLLTAALLTLNPLVLDFMVAARGYGMGLALFTWSFATVLPHLRKPQETPRRELVQAGIALGLSVAANLVFVVPAAVMVSIAAFLHPKPPAAAVNPKALAAAVNRKKKPEPNASASFWRFLVLPAVGTIVLFLLAAPLNTANSSNFYVGVGSLLESLRNLASVSMNHGGPWRTAAGLRWADAIAFFAAPAILICAAVVGARSKNQLLLLTSGTAIGSALILLLIHFAFDFPYPVDRTGLYFLMLVPLSLTALAEVNEVSNRFVCAFAALFVLQFAAEFDPRKFLVWEYDADSRHIVDLISQSVPNKAPGSIRVSSSWQLEPSLNFYRDKDRLTWMLPVTRAALAAGSDYYVLLVQDREAVNNLRPVYTGAISGTVLAVPSN